MLDATLTTPWLMRPFEHGADIVVHSLTKFMGGHGIAIGGAVVDSGRFDWAASGRFPELSEPYAGFHGMNFVEEFGPAAFVMRVRKEGLRDFGASLSPHNAFGCYREVPELYSVLSSLVGARQVSPSLMRYNCSPIWLMSVMPSHWSFTLPAPLTRHGAGMDHTVWVLLGRWLARHGHDVVIPDLPGHGRSQGTPLASIEAMADWLSRLLGKLDEAEVVPASETTDKPSLTLVGHSMGSLIATQAITSMKPDRVILLGAGYPMRVGPPLLQAAENNDPVAADMIAAFGHAYASLLGHNPLPGIPVANFARVLLLSAQPGVLHADLNACDRYTVPEDVLSGIRGSANTSVYLIAGDQDRMTPAKATKALAELGAAASPD